MKIKLEVRKLAKKKHARVRVEVVHPHAKEIFLAGSFNGWKPHANPLKVQDHGLWVAEFELPFGCYEYRFVIDGRWTSNPHAPQFARNPYGSFNSILPVEA